MKTTSIQKLKASKANGKKFAVITAYDFTFASLIEAAGIEVMLVGDSLGNVIQGQKTTVPVTVEQMAYHTAAVRRGAESSLLVADMPFMSYSNQTQALDNAATLMQAGAQMVKLEGGEWLADTVHASTERGIPVCGHIGLTPQSVFKLGGYKVQGKDQQAADKMLTDAKTLQQAGADLIVVECIPAALGQQLSESLDIPVIGIGAGPHTDAQVLVLYDMLGISQRLPVFSKNYLAQTNSVQEALTAYAEEVRSGTFPQPEHCFN
jgi:3-methyl-2-oxobutanoate hydroxymethyltransferase